MDQRGEMVEGRENVSPQVEKTTQILVEFLQVAISSIIFLKGIYPPGAFERRRYMTLVVQRARHPQLRDYIQTAVSGLKPYIQKGLVESVAIIFFGNDNTPIESFMFNLKLNLSYSSNVEESDFEFSFRSFLIKLPLSQNLTKPLPMGCRWEITAYFRALPEVNMAKEAQLWVPTDTKQWQQPPLITPIKSMTSEPLCLQLYVQHPNSSGPPH